MCCLHWGATTSSQIIVHNHIIDVIPFNNAITPRTAVIISNFARNIAVKLCRHIFENPHHHHLLLIPEICEGAVGPIWMAEEGGVQHADLRLEVAEPVEVVFGKLPVQDLHVALMGVHQQVRMHRKPQQHQLSDDKVHVGEGRGA